MTVMMHTQMITEWVHSLFIYSNLPLSSQDHHIHTIWLQQHPHWLCYYRHILFVISRSNTFWLLRLPLQSKWEREREGGEGRGRGSINTVSHILPFRSTQLICVKESVGWFPVFLVFFFLESMQWSFLLLSQLLLFYWMNIYGSLPLPLPLPFIPLSLQRWNQLGWSSVLSCSLTGNLLFNVSSFSLHWSNPSTNCSSSSTQSIRSMSIWE